LGLGLLGPGGPAVGLVCLPLGLKPPKDKESGLGCSSEIRTGNEPPLGEGDDICVPRSRGSSWGSVFLASELSSPPVVTDLRDLAFTSDSGTGSPGIVVKDSKMSIGWLLSIWKVLASRSAQP